MHVCPMDVGLALALPPEACYDNSRKKSAERVDMVYEKRILHDTWEMG